MAKRFEAEILRHFRDNLRRGQFQAVDGIERELDAGGYAPFFLGFRLSRMARKGLIARGPARRSVFGSYSGTPTFGRPRPE